MPPRTEEASAVELVLAHCDAATSSAGTPVDLPCKSDESGSSGALAGDTDESGSSGALAGDIVVFLFHARLDFLPKVRRVVFFNRTSSGISQRSRTNETGRFR